MVANNGFSTVSYIESFAGSPQVTVFPFENRETQKICCWNPARQRAADFVRANKIAEDDEKFFAGQRPLITMYFPVRQDSSYVAKAVRLRGGATVGRVMGAIETFIKDAIEYYYGAETPKGLKKYEGFTTCHIMVSRAGGYNKIYIRAPG